MKFDIFTVNNVCVLGFCVMTLCILLDSYHFQLYPEDGGSIFH